MRVMLVTMALALTAACNSERAVTRAEPQKSALRMCVGQLGAACPKPMLIVDGQRVDFDTTDLESMQIEQVDVVKGPSAIKLYGDEAKNGVVIVTRKRVLR
jgi:TonB-dependent receptor-like protein